MISGVKCENVEFFLIGTCFRAAGGGHRFPGDGHQSAGRRRLGDDAVLFQPPLHAGAGEAGEV